MQAAHPNASLAKVSAMNTVQKSTSFKSSCESTPMSVAQANIRIEEGVQGLFDVLVPQALVVSLDTAFGRTLAADMISPIHVPAYTNSAMDGFAFRMPLEPQAPESPSRFVIVGESFAGKPFVGEVRPNECIKIMTGAVMPNDVDTVAPIESVQLEPRKLESGKPALGESVHIDWARFKSGDNRRLAGEDIAKGSCVLQKGHRLHSASMGLIASLGFSEVQVQAALKVAIFSTGDELQKPGEALKPGMIFDSNRYTLKGLLQGLGCEVIDLGIVPDNPQALKHTLKQATELAQVIITSGGVSDGDADFTKSLIQEMGEVSFWKIAMRPGRPLAFGSLSKRLFFGLPGNPVAVMVTFLSLVRPALLQLMGREEDAGPLRATSLALCEQPIKKKKGRTEFQRGMTRRNSKGELCVSLSGHQGSGILSSMVQGDCLIVLEHDREDVSAQEWVTIWPLAGLI